MEHHNDHDKLIQVDAKLNILITQMNRVIYDPGPIRCETRLIRLDTLEKDMGRMRKAMVGIWLALASFILAEAAPKWSPFIHSLFK
jgi:hypothetical protein